jgi:hypothetical protein
MELFRQAEISREAERKQREERESAAAAPWKQEMAEQEAQRRKSLAERSARWEKQRKRDKRKFNKSMAKISSRTSELIDALEAGGVVRKFRKKGYEFSQSSRYLNFCDHKIEVSGEIDLFLQGGTVAMLIEVEPSLDMMNVRWLLEQLEKYRRYADARSDPRRFVAAVAGKVVSDEAMNFAHANGIHVIVQSGKAVKIVDAPAGFTPQIW